MKGLHNIRGRIALPYVALIVVATLGLTVFLSNQVRRVRLADLDDQLSADARLLADGVAPLLNRGESATALDALAHHWSGLLNERITLVAADGAVLGDSFEDRTQMDNHLGRPEIQQALADGQGSITRYSTTAGYEMRYVAVRVVDAAGGQATGVVRVALPLREIETGVSRLRRSILLAGLITALLAALLALFIAGRTTRPVRLLTQAAERLAQGDFSARLLPTRRDEIGQLGNAFRRMAEQLQEEMATLAEERGRLAAVLDYMADGVLITDEASQVQLINAAAARLVGTAEDKAVGRSLAQVIPQYQVIELWKRCREQGVEQIDTLEISQRTLFLQVIITPFQAGEAHGYLVILQDLTRIRRLETVRRDFISNISHELRTPLAGLKALVDTLRGGAIKDPPAAKRFLKRMDSEVDVLTQIVEELLELSRIESGQVPLRLGPTPVADLLIPPTDRLRPQAERAGLEMTLVVPPHLPLVLADAHRVRQAVTNLLHNAVKFTPPGGKVSVEAESSGQEVILSVRDTGVGIAAEDVPRIFERFYKADRARSGGGTGLGLAIARHIVEGHGGRVWVESVEGKGSTFYLSLPAAS